MTTPLRLQLSRRKGFDLQELSRATNGLPAIAVARPSTWGNPFKIAGKVTPAVAVSRFRRLLTGRMGPSGIYDLYPADNQCAFACTLDRWSLTHRHRVRELRGHNLACWCPPGQSCHADVLLELANRDTDSGEG